MEKVSELKLCVDTVVLDTTRFFKKNNRAAGVRARKNLQKCKKLSQEIRLMIQKTKQEEFQKKAEVASARAAETGSDHLKRGPFVDDNSYFKLRNSDVNGAYPFDQDFFFILNVAVGGKWPGYPDGTTTFPQRMVVDYVRIFDKL